MEEFSLPRLRRGSVVETSATSILVSPLFSEESEDASWMGASLRSFSSIEGASSTIFSFSSIISFSFDIYASSDDASQLLTFFSFWI